MQLGLAKHAQLCLGACWHNHCRAPSCVRARHRSRAGLTTTLSSSRCSEHRADFRRIPISGYRGEMIPTVSRCVYISAPPSYPFHVARCMRPTVVYVNKLCISISERASSKEFREAFCSSESFGSFAFISD
ncbi:hypothetical protein SeMB42_g06531 [Synchytrium endobioticum]|uniref:Uncharacterized protein n=1 Tax=Synchytrium endobioticum TaxID=286115 RepID=A0A507CD43_9FUNG|nr:hypothetical protein SeMB42_g06531 [Synchytrium endobioticum]